MRICRRCGVGVRRHSDVHVAGCGVHALRHAAATRLVEQVGDLTLAQRLLGHAVIETTARYAQAARQSPPGGHGPTKRRAA